MSFRRPKPGRPRNPPDTGGIVVLDAGQAVITIPARTIRVDYCPSHQNQVAYQFIQREDNLPAWRCHCLRCHWDWISRLSDPPRQCASCYSPYWCQTPSRHFLAGKRRIRSGPKLPSGGVSGLVTIPYDFSVAPIPDPEIMLVPPPGYKSVREVRIPPPPPPMPHHRVGEYTIAPGPETEAAPENFFRPSPSLEQESLEQEFETDLPDAWASPDNPMSESEVQA